MPRTAIAAITPIGPYPTLPVAANALDVVVSDADAANGNSVAFGDSNGLLVTWRNAGAGARTVTLTSKADQLNRTGDITAFSMGAGESGAFYVQRSGWRQDDGNLYLSGEHAEIKFVVYKVP